MRLRPYPESLGLFWGPQSPRPPDYQLDLAGFHNVLRVVPVNLYQSGISDIKELDDKIVRFIILIVVVDFL